MDITWEVSDGYVGPSGPQHLNIDTEELLKCETKEEMVEYIREAIQEDFDQRVSWELVSDVDNAITVKIVVKTSWNSHLMIHKATR
jgi:hypothetical protein